MHLVVDVGNTQTVLGAYENDVLKGQWRLTTETRITKDELKSKVCSFLALDGLDYHDITDIVIATVVPDLAITWNMVSRELAGRDSLRVSHDNVIGLKYKYSNPKEIGADRLANAVGAMDRYGAPVIVVDFGTATNIDVVDREGAYLGGTITPGVDISMRALFERAAKLSQIPLYEPEKVIGDTTASAIRSGILNGAAAQFEGLVARIKEEMGEADAPDCHVIATGGISTLVAKCTDIFEAVDKDLTIHGLHIIAKRAGLA